MNTRLRIFTFLLCWTLSSHSVHAISEGDACTDDATCQSTSTYMECGADQKCVCKEASITYFETADNKCHKYFGQVCEIATQPCPLNGYCPPTGGGTCLCNGGFTETDSHKCAKDHGGICTQDYHCDRDNFMSCVTEGSSRTCDCNKDTSTYDSTNKKCVLILNQGCGTSPGSQACAEGSECKPSTGEGNPLQCQCNSGTSENNGECQVNFGGQCSEDLHCNLAKYLLCVDSTCVCDKDQGFEDVGGGDCQANYNHDCNVETGEPKCNVNKYLACRDGQCKCRDDLTDLEDKGDCRARLEGLCSETGTPQPKCDNTQFLECIGNVCKCIGDLVGNTNGECRAPLGASCEQGEICDEVANLVCDNGESGTNRCKCNGTLQPVGGVCVAAFNEHCENGKVPCNGELFLECNSDNICQCPIELIDIGQGNCRSKFEADCGPGFAECDETQFHDCINSKCACGEGLEDIAVGECRTKIDGQCGDHLAICDENNHLTCDNVTAICRCIDKWSPVNEICKAGAGVACDSDETCNTDNFLRCLDDAEVGGKTCQCRSDLVDNGDGGCRLTIGGNCNTSETIQCDERAFLFCLDGFCGCKDDSVYDGFEKKCFLTVNNPCPGEYDQECAPNSFCLQPDGKCVCEGVLEPNQHGRCFLAPGSTCSSFDPQCDYTEFQECAMDTASGRFLCVCSPAPNLIEESAGVCRIQADSPCSDDLGAQKCTTNAQCVEVVDEHWCVCDEGLIVNNVGKCVLSYGQPCGPEAVGVCDAERFQECHHPAGVAEGQCQCSDLNNTVYDNDPEVRRCDVKAGHSCTEGSLLQCTVNSKCQSGSCVCDDGLVADSHGRCTTQSSGTNIFYSTLFWRGWANRQSFSILAQ